MAVQATNTQMQTGADTYLRPFSEAARALYLLAKSIKQNEDSWYARAISINSWTDARTDGPPNLLQSGNGANPDDFLNLDSVITSLIAIIEGTAPANDAANAAAIRNGWNTLLRACVRPVA